MSQKRTSSKIKQKQIETKALEDETKKMQQKLAALRQQVQQQKKLKETVNYESTVTKWRKATQSNVPLKDYAKKVLADRKQALNKYGIDEKKIIGAKSFEPVLSKIKADKKQQEEKDPTRLPKFQVTKIIDTKKDAVLQLPVQSLSNNFFKAKINTKQIVHRKSLMQFLEQHFLQNYYQVLKSNEINELDDLYYLSMSRQKMAQMGIAPGHQAKIIKRIKEQIEGKDTTRNTQNEDTEPRRSEESSKVSFGYGQGDINSYQALNNQDQLNKKFNKLQLNNQGLGNKLGQEDEDNQDQSEEQQHEEQQYDNVILTMPEMTEYSLQTQAQDDQSPQKVTEYNCFQCYKKSTTPPMQSSDSRVFCTQGCLNKYLSFMQKKCPECDQHFYKFDGYFEQGLWFCSLKCSPNLEAVEGMFIDWGTKHGQQ